MDDHNIRMRHANGDAHMELNGDKTYEENSTEDAIIEDDKTKASDAEARDPLELEMQPLQLSHVANDDSLEDLEDENEKILYPVEIDTVRHVGWRQALEDYLYPPNMPRSCQLMRRENIAIPACYLLVGLLQGLSSPLINVFPLDLNATEAQQTTLSSIRSLPASFKLIFGFISDNVPIGGYRRKPYMIGGWLLASLSMLLLMMFSNLHVTPGSSGCFESDAGDESTKAEPPSDAPSIPFLSLALLGFGTGFWLADVMGDSIVAEKAKLEPPDARGSIQSFCYSCRFFGLMVSAPLSTYLYSSAGPLSVILLLALLPLSILPFIWILFEVQDAPISSTPDQCREIWKTICSRAVWQPLGFVYLYNLLQVGNAAWREFLVTALHFTSCQLNLILITAYGLLYLGILAYKYWFITWSWRKVYIMTTFANGLFSVLQVLLIKGITFGLSNFLFALGDDAFAEFIQGIQFLPTTIMMVHLCPAGSEGASYAMFTTVHNSALTLSSALSSMLLPIWDVSKAALERGELQGMVNLTYLTTAMQVSAIIFVGLLPNFKEDLLELKQSMSSKIGGGIFLTVTIASILYAIGVGVLNIVAPGWMGES